MKLATAPRSLRALVGGPRFVILHQLDTAASFRGVGIGIDYP
jgi:hypothetical protein